MRAPDEGRPVADAPGRGASTTPMDVTVIIPTHNRATVLPAAIASVLAQELPAARIVVIDDGSTDGTADVVDESVVTLLRHDRPRGSGAARNTGIAAADTEWIAFLDSDDSWRPDHLATIAPALGNHAFVTTPMIDSFGRGRGNVSGLMRFIRPASLFFPENIVCTSTVVARRADLATVGGFSDLPRAQDLDLWIKLLRIGTAAALTHPTAVYSIPEEYQEEGLRSRSLAGAGSVRERYADEPWMTERLNRLVETQIAWDDFRYAQHRREVGRMLSTARGIGMRPSSVAAILETVVHRRRAKRFALRRSA